MALYAAYGSNMDPRQMADRAPHSPMAGTGWLDGWRLTFGGEDLGWEGALATVVEEPGSQVFVVLYDLTSSTSTLSTPGRAHWGSTTRSGCGITPWTGTGWPGSTSSTPTKGGLPSARYLGIMADAAEAAGAPDDYVRDLRTRPCRNIGP